MKKYHVWLEDSNGNVQLIEKVEHVEMITIYPKMFSDKTIITLSYEEEL